MSIVEDGEKLVRYIEQAINIGANQTQNTTTPQADVGIFLNGYPEWVADEGIEEAGHFTQYKGIVYRCAVNTQRIEVYAPDVATNNYNPYPCPDSNGIFPYIYGMGVKKDMLVRENSVVYRCVLNTGENDYKLIYPPSSVPALFVVVE